jgi:hypothetical protein
MHYERFQKTWNVGAGFVNPRLNANSEEVDNLQEQVQIQSYQTDY